MSTPFSAVNFQPSQLLDKSILDNLTSNQNYLHLHMPEITYTYRDIVRNQEIKIITGRALLAATKENNAHTTITFNNVFAAGCNPNVTTGLVNATQRRLFLTIDGIGQLMPDYRGFQAHVYLPYEGQPSITNNVYVPWIAIGY